MKALVCSRPGLLEYKEKERPQLKKDQAIIRIKRIGICATDLHAFEGTQPFFNYPRILGHELAADLIELDNGNGESFSEEEPITFIPYFNCGKCIACRQGKPNCCASIQVCGVHIDGGMTEYLSVPSYSIVRGTGLVYDALSLVEPLAIASHGVNRAKAEKGEYVLVIGAGPIGMGTMEMARIAGLEVIAVDINEGRLDFCGNKLKVKHTINASKENVFDIVHSITNGDMASIVIDATGNQKAINNALQYLAHAGRYILIGLQKNELIFSHPEFHKRESTLMSSRNATRKDFEHVIDCMKKGLIDPTTYITHRVKFDEVKQEFDSWLEPSKGVIKAIVELD
jgi:2-desacetyl-2-hydroxyethyl bacteriochlorophyllide A dehydrogenase